MLNCNKTLRQSLERARKSQKSIHTASINLKEASCSEAIYLPLRQVLQKKISDTNTQNPQSSNKRKQLNRSIRLMDKSISVSKKNNKQNSYIQHDRTSIQKQQAKYIDKQNQFKLQQRNKVQTDRKSLRNCSGNKQKSMKSIRLKTDYSEMQLYQDNNNLEFSNILHSHSNEAFPIHHNQLSSKCNDQQVSTKNTEAHRTQTLTIPRKEMKRIYKDYMMIKNNNQMLKKELQLYRQYMQESETKNTITINKNSNQTDKRKIRDKDIKNKNYNAQNKTVKTKSSVLRSLEL